MLKYAAGEAVNVVGAFGSVLRRAALDTTQSLYRLSPAEPRVCIRNLRYAPRIAGGLIPEYVPFVDADEIKVNASHPPHVDPSVDSDSCISYPVILLPAELAAPFQVKVSVVSTMEGDSTKEVGAPTALA
ncbi:hypothetical protein AGMMS49992_06650 [Clostridia bacterium]|nr:hypothetical protein AGMMS49992_06650 [Clostridia bacterium]